MITTITKESRKVKKKEWSIYHNIGVQQDAERFSLIDNVLDGELNLTKNATEDKTFPKSGLLKRLRNSIASFF